MTTNDISDTVRIYNQAIQAYIRALSMTCRLFIAFVSICLLNVLR